MTFSCKKYIIVKVWAFTKCVGIIITCIMHLIELFGDLVSHVLLFSDPAKPWQGRQDYG